MRRTFAIGDPQAPFSAFKAILDHQGLLHSGQLRPDVRLISMGDHFDWGKPSERDNAARDGMELVRWLSKHDPDQVVMIAGNHDLARVGELWGVSDDEFSRAQAIADRAYLAKDPGAAQELRDAFGGRFTTAEVVSRDLSTFRSEQSGIVDELLRTRRLRLAYVERGLLFVHAGVTTRELDVVGANADADDIARRLNRALDAAVDARGGGALAIPGLHEPGNADVEGLGMLYHRPSSGLTDEEKRELARPGLRRRFEPATIPGGVVQVIGHIRDTKCRRLMSDIADDVPARDGVLRILVVGEGYRHGLRRGAPGAGVMWFLDGAMSSCPTSDYELLDVAAAPGG